MNYKHNLSDEEKKILNIDLKNISNVVEIYIAPDFIGRIHNCLTRDDLEDKKKKVASLELPKPYI
ncbi:MAG: hypothetical protein PHU51_03935 [Candidatus Nanoarchaeia archaeon]|nr:hypothetical protein [Candidatus Nanoarchaeia archaeon]